MNQRPAEISYGVGACGSCRHIFLITPQLRNCPLCDRPADRAIAFTGEAETIVAVAAEAAVEASAAEPPVPISIVCPHCDQVVLLQVTEEAIAVVAPPAAPSPGESEAPPPADEPPAPPTQEEEERQEPLVAPQEGPPVSGRGA